MVEVEEYREQINLKIQNGALQDMDVTPVINGSWDCSLQNINT